MAAVYMFKRIMHKTAYHASAGWSARRPLAHPTGIERHPRRASRPDRPKVGTLRDVLTEHKASSRNSTSSEIDLFDFRDALVGRIHARL